MTHQHKGEEFLPAGALDDLFKRRKHRNPLRRLRAWLYGREMT